MSDLLTTLVKSLISSISEEDFETRLKSSGIEERNIKKLKDMVGYGNSTEIKTEE